MRVFYVWDLGVYTQILIALCQSTSLLLTQRYREQARPQGGISHRVNISRREGFIGLGGRVVR